MIRTPKDLMDRVNSVLDTGGGNTVAEVRGVIQDTIDSVGNGRAFIRAKDDVNHGVEVHYPKADSTWLLKVEAGTPPTPAHVIIRGENDQANNFLTVTLPDIFVRLDENQNDFDLAVVLGNTTISAAVAAHIDLWFTSDGTRGVTFTHDTPGAAGNDFIVSVSYRALALPSARYVSATELNVTTGEVGTIQGIINAVNAARHNGSQIITASEWNGGGSHNIGLVPNGNHHLAGGLDQALASREPLAFEYAGRNDGGGNPRTKEFLLTALATDTLSDIKGVIEGLRYGGGTPFSDKVALTGSGADTIDTVILPSSVGHANAEVEDFFGGVNATVAVAADDNAKTVTVTYATDFHYLADLINTYASGVSIKALSNTQIHQLSEAAKQEGFDFPEKTVLENGFLQTKLIYEGVWASSSGSLIKRGTSAVRFKKSDVAFDDTTLWLLTYEGSSEVNTGEIWGFVQPSKILDHAENDNVSAGSFYNVRSGSTNLYLGWDSTTEELLTGASGGSIHLNPLRIYQLLAKGVKGDPGDDGENLTDSEIGDKAFSNPPSDLTANEKSAARDAIDAGTGGIDYATVEYWQDSSLTSSVPGGAASKEIGIGAGLYAFDFAALAGNRYIHFRIPIAYQLSTVAIQNTNRLRTFTVDASSTTHRIYHSRRVTDNGVIEILLEATVV